MEKFWLHRSARLLHPSHQSSGSSELTKHSWLCNLFEKVDRATRKIILRRITVRKRRAIKRNWWRTPSMLRVEPLESRQVLAAYLLDIPGLNGDATHPGATATDMELTSFEWNLKRTSAGPKTLLTDPFDVGNIKFTKTLDSVSNDLLFQSAVQPGPLGSTRLRVVDNAGVNRFVMQVGNPRVTSFGTANGGAESGALGFTSLLMQSGSSSTVGWNLLTGGVTTGDIPIDTTIDSNNVLNRETVLEFNNTGYQRKLLMTDYEWNATASIVGPFINPATSTAEVISRYREPSMQPLQACCRVQHLGRPTPASRSRIGNCWVRERCWPPNGNWAMPSSPDSNCGQRLLVNCSMICLSRTPR